MKLLTVLLILLLLVSCSKSLLPETPETPEIVSEIENILPKMVYYPSSNQLQYDGEVIADLSSNQEIVSSYGKVLRGRTLNTIIINGVELLIYGEDGVFAVECEANAAYPDHGPTHPLCQTAHGENYDKIILCSSRVSKTPIMTAQNWPGYPEAMTDSSLGLECWVDGVKMRSNRIFTY